MYVRNQSGKIIDVAEQLEMDMVDSHSVEVISVPHDFKNRHPEAYAKLKAKNPDLMTDEHYLGVPKKEEIPEIRRPVPCKKARIPCGKKIHFVIYARYLPKVGGVETAIHQLAALLDKKKYFVTIAYDDCESQEAMLKYAEVAWLVKLGDELIDCDVCLLSNNFLEPPQIRAKKWLQWVHTDYHKYNELQLVDNKNIDTYVVVSNHVAKVCREMFGIKSKVIYNLVDPEFGKNEKDVLRLVTNARLSPEKGFDMRYGDSKMMKFVKLLKKNNVKFSWIVCGDNTHMPNEDRAIRDSFKPYKEVHFVGYQNDVTPFLATADYLVQLSDFEGCPYSVLEALQMGVPCIVTDWGGVEELVEDGVNGYIINHDIKGVNLVEIVNYIPKGFDTKQKSSIKDWEKLISIKKNVSTSRTKTR